MVEVERNHACWSSWNTARRAASDINNGKRMSKPYVLHGMERIKAPIQVLVDFNSQNQNK